MVREYRIAIGWRIMMCIISLLMIPFVGFLMWFFLTMDSIHWFSAVLLGTTGLGGIALFGYVFLDCLKGRLLILEDRLQKRNVFQDQEFLLNEIRGYRTDDHYLYIVSARAKKSPIKIRESYEKYDELLHWLDSRYSNLDLVDVQSEVEEILADDEYGENTELRTQRLHSARKLSNILNVLAVLVTLWFFLYPYPYPLVAGIVMLFPFLVIIALKMYKGLIRIDEKKKSIYPSLMLALLLPSLVLAVRALMDYSILNYRNLWIPLAITTILLLGTLIRSTKEFNLRKWRSVVSMLVIGLFMAAYAYGALLHLNCFYDLSTPELYEAEMLDKRISTGKNTSYYVALSPWGPRQETEEVKIPAYQYEQLEPGDVVEVYVNNGLLNIPWFFIGEP